MKRRHFLKKLPIAVSIPFTLANIPVNVMAENALSRMARASAAANDRVLVILQMHGGNDGINSLIPVDEYEKYYNLRPNIAIPAKNSARKMIQLDGTLPLNVQVGLHPDMNHMKAMYDEGRMTVVQGVSYENNNGSHFRGRDISFMGGGADDYYTSGWIGRYFAQEYAPLSYPEDFPNPDMLDPLALEMGNDLSLIFHQTGNIPTSISLDSNVKGFKEIVEELQGFNEERTNIDPRGIPPDFLNGSPYFKEMQWILGLEDKTEDYAERLYQVWLAGGEQEQVTYPERYPFNAPRGSMSNGLTPQLQLIARLLAGGCKTKVFLVRIGGFDTHADQVEKYDPTMGMHAALMYHISSAMNAFQKDLRQRGLEDRVLTVTTSEFGRRLDSNGSYGTDHGTGGPVFIFGKGVQPGVLGTVPNLDANDRNVEMQFDYRQIYSNIVKDWLLAGDSQTVINQKLDVIFPGIVTGGTTDGVQFTPLPIVTNVITGAEGFVSSRFSLEGCFPNPAKDSVTITFKVNSADKVHIDLLDNTGKNIKVMVNGFYEPGSHEVKSSVAGLPPGNYIYKMKAGFFSESKKMVIQ
jgi:uncharacterized protein (DUF1501 family)